MPRFSIDLGPSLITSGFSDVSWLRHLSVHFLYSLKSHWLFLPTLRSWGEGVCGIIDICVSYVAVTQHEVLKYQLNTSPLMHVLHS